MFYKNRFMKHDDVNLFFVMHNQFQSTHNAQGPK